jgi:hypothetical protein
VDTAVWATFPPGGLPMKRAIGNLVVLYLAQRSVFLWAKAERNREGMRATFVLLGAMVNAFREHRCQLLVALILTKEAACAKYVNRDPRLHLRAVLLGWVDQEAHAKARLVGFLDPARIA